MSKVRKRQKLAAAESANRANALAGISGDVDRNYWNGDRTRLVALANNTA